MHIGSGHIRATLGLKAPVLSNLISITAPDMDRRQPALGKRGGKELYFSAVEVLAWLSRILPHGLDIATRRELLAGAVVLP